MHLDILGRKIRMYIYIYISLSFCLVYSNTNGIFSGLCLFIDKTHDLVFLRKHFEFPNLLRHGTITTTKTCLSMSSVSVQ